MSRKWKDARGETLVEVLAAILIGSLSVALLFSMAAASVNMDLSARRADETFLKSLNDAEASVPVPEEDEAGDPIDPPIVPDGAKITVRNNDIPDGDPGSKAELSVNFYGGRGALSYALP